MKGLLKYFISSSLIGFILNFSLKGNIINLLCGLYGLSLLIMFHIDKKQDKEE